MVSGAGLSSAYHSASPHQILMVSVIAVSFLFLAVHLIRSKSGSSYLSGSDVSGRGYISHFGHPTSHTFQLLVAQFLNHGFDRGGRSIRARFIALVLHAGTPSS